MIERKSIYKTKPKDYGGDAMGAPKPRIKRGRGQTTVRKHGSLIGLRSGRRPVRVTKKAGGVVFEPVYEKRERKKRA